MKQLAIVLFAAALAGGNAFATTKGLSQIVTPDLQHPGELSLSGQVQNSIIGNPYQLQAELGLTQWIEGAVFQGFDPRETIFAGEAGILQSEPYLLSVGFLNYSTRGGGAQPFVETGLYHEHDKWILGGILVNSKAELLLGFAYDFDEHWRAQVDFQSGDANFATLGFTWTLNAAFQINPALYVSNAPDHRLAGYFVATYTVPLWQPKKPAQPGKPPAL